MQRQPNPHRTDLKRGKRERVAPRCLHPRRQVRDRLRRPKRRGPYEDPGPLKSDSAPHGLTLKEAQAEREKLRVNVRAGEVVAPSKMTFGEVADDFLTLFESLVAAGERGERR